MEFPSKLKEFNESNERSGLTDSSICLPYRHFIYQPEENARINLLHWTTETSPVPHPFDYHLIRVPPHTWHNKVLFVGASPAIAATTQHSNKVKSILPHRSPLEVLAVKHLSCDCYWSDNPDARVSHLHCSGSLGLMEPAQNTATPRSIPLTQQESLTPRTMSPCDMVNSLFVVYWTQPSWTGLHIQHECRHIWRSRTEELCRWMMPGKWLWCQESRSFIQWGDFYSHPPVSQRGRRLRVRACVRAMSPLL